MEVVKPKKKKLSVAFVLAPSFTMLAFSAFVDTLRLAADDGDSSRPIHCEWMVLSDDMRTVKSSSGIEVVPTARLVDPKNFDYVVVVGGLIAGAKMSSALNDYLCRAASSQVPLVGICTGSFILARLGLMKDRLSCVSWFHYDDFTNAFPDLSVSSDELFIDDRDRLTCAGGTSVVHLAAYLVGRHCDKARAAKALRIMIEHSPLPSKTLQPQPLFTKGTEDTRVRRAMLLIERHISNPISTAFVARHLTISVRHLERLFHAEIGMSPSAFALKLRVNSAYNLLVKTRSPIIDVALECGFLSNAHFSRSFRSIHGKTPTQVRDQAYGDRRTG